MEAWVEFLLLMIPFLGIILVALWRLVRYIRKRRQEGEGVVRFAWEMATLPFSFSKIFLRNQKESQLPLYFQYFLKLTRFCSRIPYFHFFPKFVVATVSEFLIYGITGEPLLTALIFVWSMSFFILITIVESMYGEFEEEVITLANKIFLYTVSVLTMLALGAWFFGWETLEPLLDNSFLNFMADFASWFNVQILALINFAWGMPVLGKILILGVFGLYVYSSLYLSKRGIK